MYYAIPLFCISIFPEQYFLKKLSLQGGIRKSFIRVGKLIKLKSVL